MKNKRLFLCLSLPLSALLVLLTGLSLVRPAAPVSVCETLTPHISALSTPEMVGVEGGTFTMGATSEQGSEAYSDEKPAHRVTVGNFFIGKYEVTQGLWYDVMGSNPSWFQGSKTAFGSRWRDLPVEQVTWDDCQEFLRKLNARKGEMDLGGYSSWKFRLPTEAEWEFAARGGNVSRGYKYSGSNNIGSVAWYDGNSSVNGNQQTHPVGTKQPNELGLYDMSGNVYEWCQDWYADNYYGRSPQNNPQGPSSGSFRVIRGGSCGNYAWNCRVSCRVRHTPGNRYGYLGLRLVLAP